MDSQGLTALNPILVVGSGAMASMFAARLSAAGFPVSMLGSWSPGMDALREKGVRILDADGRQLAYPVTAASDPLAIGRVAYALVLVKSWQTRRAGEQLALCLSPSGLALTLQNGIGNREVLDEMLGAERVAVGVTTNGAFLVEPGLVRPAGEGIVSLGEHPRLAPLADALRQSGFSVQISPDVAGLLWGKLVINAAINPIAALLEMSNGEVLENSSTCILMEEVACEAAAVAASLDIRLPYPDPQATVEAIARRTASNRSSMLQDLLRGAPTEVDAICGSIVQAAEKSGVPVPVIRTLWRLVKAKVEKNALVQLSETKCN